MNKNRVEALSDGVFAIVMTLLILEIRIPEVEYSHLAESLVEVLPRIFAYVISFGVIGVYWLAHHQSLQMVRKLNGLLIWINLIYLLAVSFMPFPTALLGRYPMRPLPIVIYGLNLIGANTIARIVAVYLRRHPELDSEYMHRARHKGAYLFIFVNGSYLLAMVLGFFAPVVSYAIFVVVLLVVIIFYSLAPVARPSVVQDVEQGHGS